MKLMLASAAWLLSCVLLSSSARAQTPAAAARAPLELPTAPGVVERGPHHRVWQQRVPVTNLDGTVTTRVRAFTELGSGLHRAVEGQWVDAKAEIVLFQDGAVAVDGAHRVSFAHNANSAVAIDLVAPDGKRFSSHVIGIAVYDPRTGASELIAQLQDSVGELHPPNVVIYPNAFTDVRADLRYTYTIGGFEQDVLLRENPALPPGFDSARCYLEVWTEFLDPPAPVITQFGRSGLLDDHLDFGSLATAPGRAFTLGKETGHGRSIPAAKRWRTVDNRVFLVEFIRYASAKPRLDKLPPAQGQARVAPPPGQGRPAAPRPFPPPPPQQARAADPAGRLHTAAVTDQAPSGPAFVLDYNLQASLTNFTFKADETYVASNSVYLSGTTTFEGGCVVKFARTNAASLSLANPAVWLTGPYRPAIFTAADDHSAGTPIGSGTLSGYYGGAMLAGAPGLDKPIQYLRISHATTAFRSANDADFTFRHAQFVHCQTAIDYDRGSGVLALENALFYDISTLHLGSAYMKATHVTVHGCGDLTDATDPVIPEFINSLLIDTANGSVEPTLTSTYVSDGEEVGVFQTVGAASHYLAADSVHRNACGSGSGLSATLLSELKTMTTYPPLVFSNTYITIPTTLTPQAQRDTDALDRGYHYPPLDFAVGGTVVSNTTLTLRPGTVLATYGGGSYALAVQDGAQLLSDGRPTSMNRMVRYNLVQEQSLTNWSSASAAASLLSPFSSAGGACFTRLRFTDFSMPAADGRHFWGASFGDSTNRFVDCQFHGGALTLARAALSVTNCLLERVALEIDDSSNGHELTVLFRNCLFYGGTNLFTRWEAGTWEFKDNLFDQTGTSQDGDVTNDHNAYTTNATRLTPTAGTDILWATNTLPYQSYALGLGRFYLPTNSPWSQMTDAGSVGDSGLLGLFYHTTATNQTREASTTNNLSFHYLGLNSSGLLLDSDGDGIPDYLEDANSNGVLDSGETQTTDANDWGLRVFITRPRSGSAIP